MFHKLFGARDYGVAYRGHNIPRCLPGKAVWGAWVRLENTGTRTWLLRQPEGKRVDLVVFWDGQVSATHHLPLREVKPGDRITPCTSRCRSRPRRGATSSRSISSSRA
jgi:hypothetical protein